MTTTASSTTSIPCLKSISTYPWSSLNVEHLFDERYPKRCFEPILSRVYNYGRTQSVLLPEINETDEETQIEPQDHQRSPTRVFLDYRRLESLSIRRMTRNKTPFHQQLKTTREELCETDDH